MYLLSGERLKNRRKRRGLTIEQLAAGANELLEDAARIPNPGKNQISSWEHKDVTRISDINAPRVDAIARVLGCDVGALLVDSDDTILKSEQDRAERQLTECGFMPGFFLFLASSLGCASIETLDVWYCRRLGVGWVENVHEVFAGEFEDPADNIGDLRIMHDAATDRVRLAGPEVDHLRQVPDDINLFDDISDGSIIDDIERGAILHYSGKRKDQYMALSDLLQLQARVGSFARFSANELLNGAD